VPNDVTLLADPADERSWAASRWLASVELSRPIALTLTMAPTEPGRRVARVALAAADLVGADGVRAVYEAYGRRRFVLGETDEGTALSDALADALLPGFLAFAADDPKWDAGLAPASEEPLVIDGAARRLPDLAAAPTGADAASLFDELAL